jgi:chromosome segregation ATPase
MDGNIHARVDRVEQSQLTLASELHQSNKLLTRIDERLSNVGEKLTDVVKMLRDDIAEVREEVRAQSTRLGKVETTIVEARTAGKVFQWFVGLGAAGGIVSWPIWLKQGFAVLAGAIK